MMQRNLFEAAAARDEGIRLSADNAGDEWGDYALGFVRDYLTRHPRLFVDDLWDSGLEKPTSPRALGSVMQTAVRRGWMEELTSDGLVLARPSAASNMQLKRVWRSLIHTGRPQ